MHISRWMAKHLYAIKTVLIGSIIHRGISQRAKFLQEVCLWNWKYLYYLLYFVYNSWWLTSPISSSAQKNDLILINSCDQYRAQDSTIGKAALNTYKNHLWPSQKNLFVLLFSVALWTHLPRLEGRSSWYLFHSQAYANLAKGMGSRSLNPLNSLQMILIFKFLLERLLVILYDSKNQSFVSSSSSWLTEQKQWLEKSKDCCWCDLCCQWCCRKRSQSVSRFAWCCKKGYNRTFYRLLNTTVILFQTKEKLSRESCYLTFWTTIMIGTLVVSF